MPEELKDLLDRIQKDGVDKAEAEAARILEKARADAAAMRDKARAEAAATLESAEAEAKAFGERARKSLQQAARDLMLSVGEALQATLDSIVAREVAVALDSSALAEALPKLIAGYFAGQAGGVELVLPESRVKEMSDFLMARFQQEMGRGIVISGDKSLPAGFRVKEKDGSVVHDLSAAAVAESLSKLLRPHLAEVVRQAVKMPAPAR